MPRTKNIIILIAVITSTYSCTPSKSLVTFEILQPGIITYPENVQNVGYLNMSPVTFDSFRGVNMESLDFTDLYILDTMYCNSIINGFKEGKGITSVPYLEEVFYLLARNRDSLRQNGILPRVKVNEICTKFGLDALIIQDYYAIEFNEIARYNMAGKTIEEVITLIQNVKWTVYLPGAEKPLDEWQFNDSLYFLNDYNEEVKTKKHTPISVLRDGATEVGYSFGIRNVPVWNEISRTVHIGHNKELKQAAKYTNEGDWEGARKIWVQNLGNEDERLTAKCAYNLAVYYELEDDIDSAIQYAKKANELKPSPRNEFYLEELRIRLQNRGDLTRQMRYTE